MHDSSLDRNLVEVLAEEFVERYRKGERPPLSEYKDRYPEHAAEIEDLFPAVLMMENLKPVEDDEKHKPSEPPLVQIGDYRILGEVGRGGMGIVYEAEQLSLGRRVAVKILPQQLMHEKKNKRRFEREAKAAARLHHTNIVPVFGVGEQDGMYYYVMQFIQGLGLDVILDELRKLQANSQAGSLSPAATLSAGRTSHEVSAAQVARSLMSGQFERTIITNLEGLADGDPLENTVDYHHEQKERPLAASATESGSSSTGTANTSSSLLSDLASGSLSLSGSFSLSGQSDGSAVSSAARARRKQTFFTSVANIGRQVASALQYAHEQGITHRDIKPSNLLLDMRNTVWVTDFGLAKSNDQQDITHTGDILGTLRYMPPEAFEGQSDARGDQYSLGLTLYELLAQKPAFDESDRHKLIKLVTTGEPARIEKLNRNVPRDLATIIHKAIDRDPAHRYASAGELADDLERFIEDEPIKGRRLSLWERGVRWSRRNRGLAAALGIVAALLLVINIAGPLMTLHMATLNSNLRTSQRELSATVHNLTETKGDLEETVQTLEATQADLMTASDEAQTRAEELEIQAVELARQQERAEGSLYAAQIALAENHLNSADAVNAERSLAAVMPTAGEIDRRGWEWYYLNRWRDSSVRVLEGHNTGYSYDVACSPDGHWIASAGGGNPFYATGGGAVMAGDVLIFDFASGEVVHRLEGHTNLVHAIAFSPDSAMLATAGHDHQIIFWSTETGEELFRMDTVEIEREGDVNYTWALRYSPDGQYVFAVSKGRTTYDEEIGLGVVYSVAEKRPVHQFPTSSADFSLDSASIYFVEPEKGQAIRVLNLATGEVTDLFPAPVPIGSLWGLTASRSGTYLAAFNGGNASRQPQTLVWHVDSRELVQVLPVRKGVRRIAFSPDDRLVCTSYDSGVVDVWDSTTGRNVATLPGTSNVTGVSFSSDSQWLAVGSFDGRIRLFSADGDPRGTAIVSIGGTTGQASALAFSADGSQLRVADWSAGRGIHIVDIDSDEELLWNQVPVTASRAWPRGDFAFSPDGRRLIAPREDDPRAATIWDAATGAEIASLPDHSGQVTAVAFSHDGKLAASASIGDLQTELRIWDASSGELLQSIPIGLVTVYAIAFSPDGKSIATGGAPALLASAVSIWNLESGERRFAFSEPAQVYGLAFSPDSQQLAAADYRNAAIYVWDAAQGNRLGEITGLFAACDVAWSPDGTRLAAIGYDANVHLFHAETLEELLVLRTLGPPNGSLGFTPCVTFSQDGSKIAANAPLGTFTIWDAGAGAADEMLAAMLENEAPAETIEQLLIARADVTIEGEPDNPHNYYSRGIVRARFGRWSDTASDFTRAVELSPDDRLHWMRAAVACLMSGDMPEYERLCREMRLQFQGTQDYGQADVVCKVCLLLSGDALQLDLPVDIITTAAANADEPAHAWYRACAALVAYRMGEFTQAIELSQLPEVDGGQALALALVIRAMAEHQSGMVEQAAATLQQAEEMIPQELRTLGQEDYAGRLPVAEEVISHDWLIPEILRREARALIGQPVP